MSQIGQAQKMSFLTLESDVKLPNSPRKIQKIIKKAVTAEIFEGFDFYPPIFDQFGQLWQAKNFFF